MGVMAVRESGLKQLLYRDWMTPDSDNSSSKLYYVYYSKGYRYSGVFFITEYHLPTRTSLPYAFRETDIM